ncbi:transcriptional regulator [Acinetobacter sp. ANC 4558]|uniref:Rrf2 family transcriptional regulator n=1 Tax=Acinetobacter sp. ANC 4558 TaxID=1977876 RepID=UPI000A3563C5|nr:Rrf2 family transcriptional regulator [Acinetobacter sp. ANC 4558]OTG85617.1 transcriptional regulator [Acinetobacter sp. ANC 4558]
MRTDSRLSRMLHVILHLSHEKSPLTSEQIAQMLGTNPVVIRRTMAGLKKQGYVSSEKGHHGGWILSCDLTKISLFDIYQSVGEANLFTIGIDESHPNCIVEQVVNHAVVDILKDAEILMINRLKSIKLSDLAAQFNSKLYS